MPALHVDAPVCPAIRGGPADAGRAGAGGRRRSSPAICLARKEAYLDSIRGILGPDFSALCPQIKAPTLVVCGRLDVTTPVDQTSDLTRLIPNARETIIEAAHLGIWENPDAFDRVVIEFLDAQEGRAAPERLGRRPSAAG